MGKRAKTDLTNETGSSLTSPPPRDRLIASSPRPRQWPGSHQRSTRLLAGGSRKKPHLATPADPLRHPSHTYRMEACTTRSELRKLWPLLLARGSQPTHVWAGSRWSAGARCWENTETLPADPGRSRNRLTLDVGRSCRNPTNCLSPPPVSAPPLPAPAWWAWRVFGPEWFLGPGFCPVVSTSVQSE